jgi:hypothetical protein
MFRESYVPYTKLVTINSTAAQTINLTDSEGTSLRCNYIQVVAVSGSSDGTFFVCPDLASGKGFANQPIASNADFESNSLSGALGVVSNRETGVAVLSLPAREPTSTVKISQSDALPCMYAITYGNVTLRTPALDNKLPRGN